MRLADIIWNFDAELREGKNPQIESFLPLLDDGTQRLDLIVELVRCELSQKKGMPGILEGHLVRFDELGSSPDHILALILHERRERLRSGNSPRGRNT